MLIPLENAAFQKYEVSRDGSTWIDLTSYIVDAEINLGNTLNIGTGNTGADDTVRKLNFTIKNEGSNRFCPLIQTSAWNQVDDSYSPLLWPMRYIRVKNREMQDRRSVDNIILAVGDGSTTTFPLEYWPVINSKQLSLRSGTATTMADLSGKTMAELSGKTMAELSIIGDAEPFYGFSVDNENGTITFTDVLDSGQAVFAEWLGYWETDFGWRKIFEGYIAKVDGNDKLVNLPVQCEDKSRLLKKYIKTETQYGSAEGTAAETVIQDILDDNFGPGTIILNCPVSPEFAILDTDASKVGYCTVWEAIQKISNMIGWFLGYWYDEDSDSYELTFFAPPWSKSASNGNDFYLTGSEIYIQNFSIVDDDIRNDITVKFFNQATNQRDEVNVQDSASIALYGEKPAVFEEDSVSLIDTAEEATNLAERALTDMKDMPIGGRIEIPLFPRIELFSGVVTYNTLQSSTEDFYAVNSIRHFFRYGSGNVQVRTECILDGKVQSGHFKWLRMENRTGAAGDVKRKILPGTNYKGGSLLDATGAPIVSNGGFNGKIVAYGTLESTYTIDAISLGAYVVPTGKKLVCTMYPLEVISTPSTDTAKNIKQIMGNGHYLYPIFSESSDTFLPAGSYSSPNNLEIRHFAFMGVKYDDLSTENLESAFKCYYEVREVTA